MSHRVHYIVGDGATGKSLLIRHLLKDGGRVLGVLPTTSSAHRSVSHFAANIQISTKELVHYDAPGAMTCDSDHLHEGLHDLAEAAGKGVIHLLVIEHTMFTAEEFRAICNEVANFYRPGIELHLWVVSQDFRAHGYGWVDSLLHAAGGVRPEAVEWYIFKYSPGVSGIPNRLLDFFISAGERPQVNDDELQLIAPAERLEYRGTRAPIMHTIAALDGGKDPSGRFRAEFVHIRHGNAWHVRSMLSPFVMTTGTRIHPVWRHFAFVRWISTKTGLSLPQLTASR